MHRILLTLTQYLCINSHETNNNNLSSSEITSVFFLKVHPYFKDLIENSSVIWNSTSFQDEWPSLKNIPHFEK